MPVHDAVGVNCANDTAIDIKAQVPNIWTKRCMMMIVLASSDLMDEDVRKASIYKCSW